jgi:hypothetical protein
VGQHAARPRRPADLLDHPLEHRDLDRRRGGAHLVDRHRVVDHTVDEVGQRRRHVGHGDLVGQRAGMVQARRARQVVAQEPAEALGVHPALAQPAAQVEVGHHVAERRVGDRRALAALAGLDVAGELRDRRFGCPLQLVGVGHDLRLAHHREGSHGRPRTTGARTQAGSGRG